MHPHLSLGAKNQEVSLRIHFKLVHTCKAKFDLARVSACGHHEVILQLPPLRAVVEQVHARIDGFVFDFGVGGNVRAPLPRVFADEVVALAGKSPTPVICGLAFALKPTRRTDRSVDSARPRPFILKTQHGFVQSGTSIALPRARN